MTLDPFLNHEGALDFSLIGLGRHPIIWLMGMPMTLIKRIAKRMTSDCQPIDN